MRRATVERLRDVAATYRHAIRAGQPPTTAVAFRFKVSHSHAANLVAKARQAGLLEATTRGRAHAKVDRANG